MRTKQQQQGVDYARDEYYTLPETAEVVAEYVSRCVDKDCPIDCPADSELSEIPQALFLAGFTDVSFYVDLPYIGHDAHVRPGAVIVTNPPFSMRPVFSAWLRADTSRRFLVCSTLVDFPTYGGGSVRELFNHKRFMRPDGSLAGVATCWVTNFGSAVYPRLSDLLGKAAGFCMLCRNSTCVMRGTDTVLYTVHAGAKAGGVYSFCNRYQETKGKCSFGRLFLTKGLEPTFREKDRRV